MNKEEQLKAHKMTDKVWYHGTGSDIHAFSHDYVGKGKDQFGTGFYFTDSPDTASGYALDTEHDGKGTNPNIIPVHLALTKAVPHNKPFTKLQIHKLIRNAPDWNDLICNVGDVDYEGEHKVMRNAVDLYKDSDAIDALHTIQNDFYPHHPKEFLTNVTKYTGYDHSIHEMGNGEKVAVVFHPHQIRSVHAKFNPKNIKSPNLTESTLRESLLTCLTQNSLDGI